MSEAHEGSDPSARFESKTRSAWPITGGYIGRVMLNDQRRALVRARDASADGTFVYSVKTTGVYCRPSCPARRARPENIEFHAGPAAAERAGFRPCKRCKPEQPPLADRRAAWVTEWCRRLEQDDAPTLAELATGAGLSVFHSHRLFKAATGLTPRAYAAAHRATRVRAALTAKGTVTEAIYRAGYGSSGRFYERAGQILGMTPTKYRAGGAALEIRFAIGQCTLGAILVAATEKGVCAVLLGDDPGELARELERRFPQADIRGAAPSFERLVSQVVGLIEQPRRGAKLPLDIRGTAFQERVWQALRRIPVGKTASYSEIARIIEAPKAARAVARACATNSLAILIPCHRVVRSDGDLSGYRWGVERKRELLARERRPKG